MPSRRGRTVGNTCFITLPKSAVDSGFNPLWEQNSLKFKITCHVKYDRRTKQSTFIRRNSFADSRRCHLTPKYHFEIDKQVVDRNLRVVIIDFMLGQGNLRILLQMGPNPRYGQLYFVPTAKGIQGPEKWNEARL